MWPVFYGGAAASHHGLFPERKAEYGPAIAAKLARGDPHDAGGGAGAREAMAAWQRTAAEDPPST